MALASSLFGGAKAPLPLLIGIGLSYLFMGRWRLTSYLNNDILWIYIIKELS
jgi:hypothetical protein